MAADLERPSHPNGSTGRPCGIEEDEIASATTQRSDGEDDVAGTRRSATVKLSSQSARASNNLLESPVIADPTSTTSSPPSGTSPPHHPLCATSCNSASRIPSLNRKGNESHSRTRSASAQDSPFPTPAVQQVAQVEKLPPVHSLSPSPERIDVLVSDKSTMPTWIQSRRLDQDSVVSVAPNKRMPMQPEDNAKVDRGIPRGVSRGINGVVPALETVQEAPSDLSTSPTDTTVLQVLPEEPRLPKIEEGVAPSSLGPNPESGSDSSGNKSSGTAGEVRAKATASTNPRRTVVPKQSSASLAGTYGKPADGPVRSMTVETETVSTIPQVSVGVTPGDRNNAGRSDQSAVRMKQSMETIRPRKEKRKTRRPAALASGTASSKADIFEAKVASAVDEADVSDSDETFVYESNPPDPYPGRPPRYHSRTPSATSMGSQADQFSSRTRPGLRDSNHSVTGKRSMKFTNNTYNSSVDGEAGDDTIRHPRTDGGTLTPRRHHIGRYSRSTVYPSLFDGDSIAPPSQPASRSMKHFIGGGFRHSRTAAQRSMPNYRTVSNPKRMGDAYSFDYDADGADDERTPLVGSPRISRGRNGRRPNSASLRQMEYMQRRQRSYFPRYGTSALIGFLILLGISGAITFIIVATKPLIDVKVIAIQNVLASEQEIMLDLSVQATNPSLFPVVVDDMDVNIFARSRYVGSENFWQPHESVAGRLLRAGSSRNRARFDHFVRCLTSMNCSIEAMHNSTVHTNDGVDRGTDPIDTDPEGDAQTMLLGRVFRFDSPLAFEPSPWNYRPSRSKGQIRLTRPGNKTEEGGTERWERVLQHQFELIVRGIIKYELSLSSRIYSASISSSTNVVPQQDGGNSDEGSGGKTPYKNETTVSRRRWRTLPLVATTVAPSEPARYPMVSARTFTA